MPENNMEPEDEENVADWREGLCMDIEAPHCGQCDDWHYGPCRISSDQPSE